MSLFRPAVVSEYQRAKVSSSRMRWQAFRGLTWFVTAGAGLSLVLAQSYRGDSQGNHALSGLQRTLHTTYEAIMTGEWNSNGVRTIIADAEKATPPEVVSSSDRDKLR